jgi:inner membrane transporter RhtA
VAVGQFATINATAVAWWRLVLGGLVLVAILRPWRRSWTRRGLVMAVVFGIVMGLMNIAFYTAIDHLPLGVAVSIEFSGPLAVAAATGRGWRERAAIAVAATGVVLLAGVTLDAIPRHDAVVGLVAIIAAAGLWAGYIMLGKRVSGAGGLDSLAVGMVAGALVLSPWSAWSVPLVVPNLRLLGLMLVIAVGASVIPYGIDQVVLRRMGTAKFAVFTALLPASAAIVGVVVLRQVPSVAEVGGFALVTVAILMTARA